MRITSLTRIKELVFVVGMWCCLLQGTYFRFKCYWEKFHTSKSWKWLISFRGCKRLKQVGNRVSVRFKGFHGKDYGKLCRLGSDAVQSGESVPTFRLMIWNSGKILPGYTASLHKRQQSSNVFHFAVLLVLYAFRYFKSPTDLYRIKANIRIHI